MNHSRLSLFAILAGFVFSTPAFSNVNPLKQELRTQVEERNTDRNYTGDVIYTLMGRRFDDPFVNSRWGRAIIEINMGLNYETWLEANFSAAQLLTSGASSYQLGVTEAGPSSGLFLNEASLTLKPLGENFKLTGGVLDVSYGPIYSLFTAQAQAGANINLNQKGESSFGQSKINFDISQSIPASAKGNIITDEGTNPLLTLAVLSGELKNVDTGSRLRASVTHYEYTDLSTSTATDSQKTGSTVLGSKDFQFAYEFRGREFALGFDQEIGLSHKLEWRGSSMSNERAPAENRDGWQQQVRYTRTFNKWKLIPSITQFRVESDALPSSYGISSFGFTNRQGYNVTVKVDFPKDRFNFFGGYTNAKAIVGSDDIQQFTNSNLGTFQADREIFTLGAEVTYDIF